MLNLPFFLVCVAVPQVFHDQEEAGEEAEAEQAYSLLDPHEDRQHHQVFHFSLCNFGLLFCLLC